MHFLAIDVLRMYILLPWKASADLSSLDDAQYTTQA